MQLPADHFWHRNEETEPHWVTGLDCADRLPGSHTCPMLGTWLWLNTRVGREGALPSPQPRPGPYPEWQRGVWGC